VSHHHHLDAKIKAAIRLIDGLLKTLSQEKSHVTHFGATDIDPKHLAVCLCVQSDAECKRMINELDSIRAQVLEYFASVNYPAEAIPSIDVSIASQETVNRDFAGSWWYFFK
jgi:hypothetical protein